jgi:hypothetical protein
MARRPTPSELFSWMLVGTSLGLVAGYLTAELAAPLRTGGPLRPSSARRHPPSGSSLADLARTALAGDPVLGDLDIEALPASAGVVELHGWVPDRRTRARAGRVVAATGSIREVVNCLLVRGEDDLGMNHLDEIHHSA